jgi:hypothetical protein
MKYWPTEARLTEKQHKMNKNENSIENMKTNEDTKAILIVS